MKLQMNKTEWTFPSFLLSGQRCNTHHKSMKQDDVITISLANYTSLRNRGGLLLKLVFCEFTAKRNIFTPGIRSHAPQAGGLGVNFQYSGGFGGLILLKAFHPLKSK